MQQLPRLKSALEQFLSGTDVFLWLKDERIYAEGGWIQFDASFGASTADLLATKIRTYDEDPAWNWWASLRIGEDSANSTNCAAALLPLARYSRAAAEAILSGIASGWYGHPEVLIPTLVRNAGLCIEDIGGTGSFTPKERMGRWYDDRTWHWKGPVEFVPHMLHFPVSSYRTPLAALRIAPPLCAPAVPRLLFVSPVGIDALPFLGSTLQAFLGGGAECLLLQYDEAQLKLPTGVRLVKDRGTKWELGIRYLHPDSLGEFDYLFFWDDDLDVNGFSPLRFVEIMRQNRLDMAQPAIMSNFWISHEITARHPCPPPRLGRTGRPEYAVVGRLTNFVEIMAPVFTRQGWLEFYGYLDPENSSGWGYDYIPLGRKGVVDVMPVIHTRPVRSICEKAKAELSFFIAAQGLSVHRVVNQGMLFERL